MAVWLSSETAQYQLEVRLKRTYFVDDYIFPSLQFLFVVGTIAFVSLLAFWDVITQHQKEAVLDFSDSDFSLSTHFDHTGAAM